MTPVDTPRARVLLVGYGSAGRGIHTPHLVAAGAPPAVVVTANPDRVDQLRADLPAAVAVPDLAAGLASGPDLVVIASPTGVHAEQALACATAGVATVVDKPLAADGDTAAAVVEAFEAAGVPLTVFLNRRWDDEHRALARLLAEGALGSVHRFERRWERWRPVPRDRWRENAPAEQGGGLLHDLGTHLVDSAVQLFGPVGSVHAQLRSITTRADDDVFVSLRHTGGVVSHLTASSLAGAPGPRTRVLGSLASYVVTRFGEEENAFEGFDDAPGATGWLVAGADRSPVPTPPGGIDEFYPAVLAALDLPADRRQSAMPVDPVDAVRVAQVLDAARASAAGDVVVRL